MKESFLATNKNLRVDENIHIFRRIEKNIILKVFFLSQKNKKNIDIEDRMN